MATLIFPRKVTVHHRKTGRITYRNWPSTPAPEPTELQKSCRNALAERSRKAAAWLRSNDSKACPPDGSEAFRKVKRRFDRQNREESMLRFVMAHMDLLEEDKI